MMRIITGRARGTHLYTLEGDATRPTAERAKEAIFSALQFEIEGRRVLDLFGGSGQMGLEALSRGAAAVDIVDLSDAAVKIINQNIKKVGLDGARCVRADYADFLRSAKEKYDIVFLDPPYRSDSLCDALLRIHEEKIIKDTGVVVCESDREDIILGNEEVLSKYTVEKNSGYGKVRIMILRPVYETL